MSCDKCNDCNENLVPGPVGPKGLQGVKGEPGNSILCGETNPSETIGACGDVYLDTVTGDFYVKDEFCQWKKKGNLRGPAGISGAEGPPTEDGSFCGEIYVDLLTGQTYTWNCETETWDPSSGTGFQGPEGPQGPQGPEGPQGPAGDSGEAANVSFEPWNNLALNNGFQVVSGTSASYTKMGGSGLVKVRGNVFKKFEDVLGGFNEPNYIIATLPAGYRPSTTEKFAVHWTLQNGGTLASFADNDWMTVYVQPTGEIRASKISGVVAGTVPEDVLVYFDLAPLIFWAEN